jgi:hypothetical protein
MDRFSTYYYQGMDGSVMDGWVFLFGCVLVKEELWWVKVKPEGVLPAVTG